MERVDTRTRLRLALQHRLNPLHIYCRLVPILGRPRARSFASMYEGFYRMVL